MVAGGLVRHDRNGLVVPAGDVGALAAAMRRLAEDSDLRHRLGAAAEHDVRAFSPERWAKGFSDSFASLGVARPTLVA